MMLFMLSLGLLLYLLLIVLSAANLTESKLSTFELRRREASGDPKAKAVLRKEEQLALAMAFRQPFMALLLVLLTVCLVVSLDWTWGVVMSVAAALLYGRIASVPLVTTLAARLINKNESSLLKFSSRYSGLLRLLAGKSESRQRIVSIGSVEELRHVIDVSQHLLSDDDKKLVMGSLAFRQKRVCEVMTERSDIVAVEHTELLGPLVLSDLHKSGHSSFPVIEKDLDHVIGMLDTRSQFALEAKRSLTAAKTMTPKVFKINGNETLDRALAAFVHTRHHLLIVRNEKNETIGLVSLGDVLEALFGERIADASPSE